VESDRALTRSDLITLIGGAALLISMFALPWFVLSPGGVEVPGSSGNAFRWLGDVDIVLVVVAVVAVALPILRLLGDLPGSSLALGLATIMLGIVAFVLIGDRIISPPGLADDAFGHFGGSAGEGASTRIGAWAGLIASAGIAAGGLIRIPEAPPAASRKEMRDSGRPGDRDLSEFSQEASEVRGPAAPRFAAVSAEELEAAGLSPTQARRVVRYRDELGLVDGLGDIDRVPGIPQHLREQVKAKLQPR
jgi:hypothetical protein